MEKEKEKKSKSLIKVMSRSLLSVFTSAIAIVCILSSIASYLSSTSMSEESMQNIATIATAAVENKLSEWRSTIKTVAISESIRSDKSEASKIAFLNSEAARLGFDSLSISDLNGNLLGSTNNVLTREYFSIALGGETTIASPFFSNVTNKNSIAIATPFYDGGSTIQGVIVATVDSSVIWDIVENITIFDTGFVYLVNQTGVMVAYPDFTLVQNGQSFTTLSQTDSETYGSAASVTQNKILKNSTGTDYYVLDGVKRLLAFDTLENGWRTVAVVPQSEILSDTILSLIIMVFATGLLSFAILFYVRKFATSIALPIQNVTNRLTLLTHGDISSPVEECFDETELGLLTHELDFVVRWLKRTIGEISFVLQNIADGDLTVEPKSDYPGETLAIKESLEKICLSLNETMSTISSSSEYVDSSASQVNLGSQILSEGSISQASSIEEVSQTIDSVANSIQTSAENSIKARELSNSALEQVAHSSDQMQRMLTAMQDISNSSDEIAKIIKVIDDIAFQTNILSLNASVEAARAGTNGKGFAVVAEEVRNLASKSAAASKQTAKLINESIEATQRGSGIAEETAVSLDEIKRFTKEIALSIKEISVSAEEQAESSVHVKADIHNITNIVQTNTATAEESAAASEELTSQSNALRNQIERFKLKKSESEF